LKVVLRLAEVLLTLRRLLLAFLLGDVAGLCLVAGISENRKPAGSENLQGGGILLFGGQEA
jgi:hypothetical protein